MSSPATQICIPSNVKLIKNLICTQWKNRSRVESSKKWTIYIGWLFSTFQNEFNHFHPANYISRIIYWANDVADSLFYLIYLFGSSVIKMFTSIYMLIISESLFFALPSSYIMFNISHLNKQHKIICKWGLHHGVLGMCVCVFCIIEINYVTQMCTRRTIHVYIFLFIFRSNISGFFSKIIKKITQWIRHSKWFNHDLASDTSISVKFENRIFNRLFSSSKGWIPEVSSQFFLAYSNIRKAIKADVDSLIDELF